MITIPISVQEQEITKLDSTFKKLDKTLNETDKTLRDVNRAFVDFEKASKAGLGSATNSTKQFTRQTSTARKESSRFFSSFNTGIAGVRTGLSGSLGPIALFSAVVLGAKEATAAVVRFSLETETAFARLGTISGNLSLGIIEEQLIDLSRTVPQSLGDLTDAAFTAVSAGVRSSEDDLREFIRVSAQLATVAGTDTNTAVNALARTIQGFGKDLSEASEVADIFFQITDKGIAPTRELAEFFPELAAGASIAGISLRETAQAFAAISRVQGVARAKTAIDQLFASLTVTTPASEELSTALGIDLSKAGIDAAGGLVPFINNLKTVINDSPKVAKGLARTNRAFRALALLTGTLNEEFNDLTESFQSVESTAGKADAAFIGFSQTGAVQLDLAIQAIQTAFKGVGDSILDFAIPALQKFSDFVNDTSELDKLIRSLREVGVASGELQALEDISEREKGIQQIEEITRSIEDLGNSTGRLGEKLKDTAIISGGVTFLNEKLADSTQQLTDAQNTLASARTFGDENAVSDAQAVVDVLLSEVSVTKDFLTQAIALTSVRNRLNDIGKEEKIIISDTTEEQENKNVVVKTASQLAREQRVAISALNKERREELRIAEESRANESIAEGVLNDLFKNEGDIFLESEKNAQNAFNILNQLKDVEVTDPELSPFQKWVDDLGMINIGLVTLQAGVESFASSTASTLGNALNPFIAAQDKVASNFREVAKVIGTQVVSALVQAIIKASILRALTSFFPGVGGFLGIASGATGIGGSGTSAVSGAFNAATSIAPAVSSGQSLGKTTNFNNTSSFGDINISGVSSSLELEDTIKFKLLPEINRLVNDGERLNSSRLV